MVNSCGIVAGHAYSVIAAFELQELGETQHKMYMLRNPWGITGREYAYGEDYSYPWDENDDSWTENFISQVPYNINPTVNNTGIFFIEHTDFIDCLNSFQIGHDRSAEGYTDTWFDKEDDYGFPWLWENYKIEIPEVNGDIYITIESYGYNIVPYMCTFPIYAYIDYYLYDSSQYTDSF